MTDHQPLPVSHRRWHDWGDDEHPDPAYRHCMVGVHDAAHDAVFAVLAAGTAGRSNWKWFRFPNGDLVLGVFPQGDTYMATEGDHS